jgi:hypothetical protein
MQPAAGTGKPVRSPEVFEMFMKPAERRDRFGGACEHRERQKRQSKIEARTGAFLAPIQMPQERQMLPPTALGLLRFPGKLHSRMASERALLPAAR